MQWANQSGFTTIPALGMTSRDTDQWSDIAYTWEADLYIPTVYHVGPDMTVRAADNGNDDPGAWL
jgi:hypothetical protein